MPLGVVNGGPGSVHAYHPVFGWRLKVFAHLDGAVRLFSAEQGSRFFNLAPFHRDACRTCLHLGGRDILLDFNAMADAVVTRFLGAGYFRAEAAFPAGTLIQEVVLRSLRDCHALVAFRWEGRTDTEGPPQLTFPTNVPDQPVIGPRELTYDVPRYGQLVYQANGVDVASSPVGFTACLSQPLVVRMGYGPKPDLPPTMEELEQARKEMHAFWRARLGRLNTDRQGAELRELRWSLIQMISAATWDDVGKRLCGTNGGLYLGDPLSTQLDQPGGFYSYRDGNMVAWAAVETFPELARDQILRNFEVFRHDWGIPQSSGSAKGSIVYKAPGGGTGPQGEGAIPDDLAIASDQVYWLLLALTEYLRVTGELDLLDLSLSNAHGESKTIRQHLDDMLLFADVTVGYGPHGLCRFLTGDWSDYLGRIGSRGRGESFFNVALSILAKRRLAWVYDQAGEQLAATELRQQADSLRAQAEPYLTGPWFPRAIADDGQVVGGEDDRLYLEAHPWLALALCGSAQDRRRALLAAFHRCMTPIGPVIIDRGLTCADWPARTHCHYPPGCGENAGIWWIAGYWLAMALDQEGMTDLAEQVYRSCSADNHHEHYPLEWWSPFMSPDGIDGRESPTFGKAQQGASGFNREANPHEVAKFAFQVYYATRRGENWGLCW